MPRTLNVYLQKAYVGLLLQDDSGQISFTYAKDWLDDPWYASAYLRYLAKL